MRKMLLLLIGMCYVLFLNAQANDIIWQKIMGGTQSESAYDIQQTADGGYIVAGSSDSYDGDVSSTNGEIDFWVVKTNEEGDIEWENTYGGSDWDLAKAIKPTSDGGYIIIGYTYSDDGDITTMNGFRDAWVVKINSSGDLQWQKAMGGSGADLGVDVIANTEGYLVLGFAGADNDGDLTGTSCDSDYWIAQLDFSGQILWQECFGGSDIDVPERIIPAGDNYVIVGKTDSDDGDITINHGYDDMWIVQIDDVGNMLGQKTLGGSSLEIARDAYYVTSGSTDQIVIVGSTASSDGDISFNHGGLDYWVVVLDEDLNLITEKTFGGSSDDEAYSILPASDGTFTISGSTQSSDGDVTSLNGGADAWVINVDLLGNLTWEKSIGGSKADVAYTSIGATNDNGFVLAGWTRSDELSGYQGNDDLWVVQLGDASSAVETNRLPEDILSIYPNPGIQTNTIYIEHDLPYAERLIVRDLSGQQIFEKVINDNSRNISFYISNWSPGTYVITIYGSLQVQTGKIVILE